MQSYGMYYNKMQKQNKKKKEKKEKDCVCIQTLHGLKDKHSSMRTF